MSPAMPRTSAKLVKKTNKRPASTRAEQRERTRAIIVDNAISIFAEVGFDSAQMREIAARSGVVLSLVHYHFGSKIKLWKTCVDHLFDRAEKEGGYQDIEEKPGNELLVFRRLVRNYVEFSARHPEWARILNDEARHASPRLTWIVDRHLKKSAAGLQAFFIQMQKKGHLPDTFSPLVLHYIFWGMSNTLFTMAAEVKTKTGIDPIGNKDLVEEQIRAIEFLFLGNKAP